MQGKAGLLSCFNKNFYAMLLVKDFNTVYLSAIKYEPHISLHYSFIANCSPAWLNWFYTDDNGIIFTPQIQNPRSRLWRTPIMTRYTLEIQFHSLVTSMSLLDGRSSGSKAPLYFQYLEAVTPLPLLWVEILVHTIAKLKEELNRSSFHQVSLPSSMLNVRVWGFLYIWFFFCMCK